MDPLAFFHPTRLIFPWWELLFCSQYEELYGMAETVEIVGRLRLDQLATKHPDARSAVNAWVAEVAEAHWRTPSDVKARFPRASFLKENRVIFDLKGNKYRLDTTIAYQREIVVVRRAGTHAEYSKWNF